MKKVGSRHNLVTTQMHHNVDSEERQVYREGTLAQFLSDPEFVRSSVEDNLNAPILRVKIGNQYFDNDRWIHRPNRRNRPSEMIGPAVLEIVACDSRDHDVFQFHAEHRLGYALRFVFLQRERLCRCYCAKSACAGATIASDHKGGCALAPTFPAVRALRALANRVQPQIGNQRLR